MAEVVSRRSRTRDSQTKRDEHHVFDVAEYSIVDPAFRRVEVHQRSADGWNARIFESEATIPSLVPPDPSGRVEDRWTGLPDDD